MLSERHLLLRINKTPTAGMNRSSRRTEDPGSRIANLGQRQCRLFPQVGRVISTRSFEL